MGAGPLCRYREQTHHEGVVRNKVQRRGARGGSTPPAGGAACRVRPRPSPLPPPPRSHGRKWPPPARTHAGSGFPRRLGRGPSPHPLSVLLVGSWVMGVPGLRPQKSESKRLPKAVGGVTSPAVYLGLWDSDSERTALLSETRSFKTPEEYFTFSFPQVSFELGKTKMLIRSF